MIGEEFKRGDITTGPVREVVTMDTVSPGSSGQCGGKTTRQNGRAYVLCDRHVGVLEEEEEEEEEVEDKMRRRKCREG